MILTRGNLARSTGVAVAALAPTWRMRATVLAGSYAVGWFVGPRGLQLLSVTGADCDNPVLRDGIPLVSSTASWTAAHLAVLAGLRALPVPRVLTVPAYAAALAVVEPRVLAAVEASAASGRR